jgi:UDPglucose 6-dehydrogenase
MQISVVGLGKVGLSLTSCLVAAGHNVVGADVDASLVDCLNRRLYPTSEPGVAERFSRPSPGTLTATTEVARAVRDTDATFVIVPTPSNVLGGFSLRYVLAACDDIGHALREKTGRHTIAIVSTLLPGSSDAIVIPRIEAASGKKQGSGFGYCYNPSFIALGEVVNGIERPDYLLIGEADALAGDTVLSIHQSIVTTSSPVSRMTPVEAEIAKIASNTHETMRVSFANMLLSICSEVPGANVDHITEALAHRMGRRFFKGAVPYGGPCWPRDNVAFSAFMDAIRTPSALPRAVDTVNAEHGRYVFRKILEQSNAGDTVGLLGLAYKPGTPIIDRAFAIDLATWLMNEDRSVVGWDPLAEDEVRALLGARIAYADSAAECLNRSDVAVVTLPMPQLMDTDWTAARNLTVIDCWRCLPADVVRVLGRYVPLGIGPSTDVASWLEKVAGDYFHRLTS